MQKIPKTQLSADFPSSDPEDKNSIIENIHKTDNSTKRKRNVEPQNLAYKKPKKTAGKPTIINEISPLVTRFKNIE
jgi:hypothetical protein